MPVKIAAVQATYVLMDREATIDRVAELTASAVQQGAQLVVFPEAFDTTRRQASTEIGESPR